MLCLGLLQISCTPGYKKLRAPVIRGATVAHVHDRQKGYGSGISKNLYQHIRSQGYNAIQLNSFAYQKEIDQIELRWDDPTLTATDLEREIDIIRSFGLQIMLKPHIWIGTEPKPKVWRSEIDYKELHKVDRWFQEYKRFLREQVLLAAAKEVEFFVIGTELVKLTKYREHWRDLIATIRKWGYQGQLTYACEAWNAKNIHFWDQLDLIGINFYYGHDSFRDGSRAAGQRQLQELEEFYIKKITEHLLHAKSYGLPLIFTELGFPSHRQGIYRPASWGGDESMQADQLTQERAYLALSKAMASSSYPYGIWIWKYVTSLDSYESKNWPKGFILQNKRAEQTVARMLQGNQENQGN